MTSMDDGDRQGRTADGHTKYSRWGGSLFYSDSHARFFLSLGPGYLNVFLFRADVPGAEVRHIPGNAHNRRDLAERNVNSPRYGRAAYRIVVKPKRVSA